MYLIKILLSVPMKKSNLFRFLILYKYSPTCRSISKFNVNRTLTPYLLDNVFLNHSQYLSRQTSIISYPCVPNEELAVRKHSDKYITVPTLEFEDVPFEQPVSHKELCDALQICNSVEEQMLTLTSTLALSPEDVQRRMNFCKKIESLFRPFFGEIKIQMFGSTMNGFGFKGCDIDMSFETFGEQKLDNYLERPDVPLVSEVMSGKVLPCEISALPPKEQLLFIHTVLLEFYKESNDPIIFINAHVPLVRFYHDKYNLKCDLSCRNKVAFANSKLLYLFGKLDPRVIPMMMTLRYWAKHVELIGKGLMFNTYTISLMIIHFLQTRNPPVLPSAEYILSLTDRLQIEDMSDTSFLQIKKYVPESKNIQTLDELLRDFFFYYLYFDFTRVICPLIGGSVPRNKFFTSETSKKFKMNTICVQDPMLVTHNVAELVDYKHCKKLFTELLTTCQIFQKKSDITPSTSSKWGLLLMLDKPDEYQPQNIISQKNVSFTVPLIKKDILNVGEEKDINILTAKTLISLLKYVLLFECKSLEVADVLKMLKAQDEVAAKQKKLTESAIQQVSEVTDSSHILRKAQQKLTKEKQKLSDSLMLDDFQKLNSENKIILCAECRVTKNIWLGRDFVSLDQLPEGQLNNLIAKEHFISVSAAKQNELNSLEGKTKPFIFFYECYLPSKGSESSILVNFRPFQRSKFNPILGVFLREYLPKLIENLEAES